MIAQHLEWIKEGYYVDAKDKQNNLQVGLILVVNKTHVKIRFDGWASKFDEILPLHSQKIKPFRTLIKGYTGQKKNPATRQHWDFSLQNHELRLKSFEQFTNHLSEKSAFEITQYLRGENYFYIDHLLTLIYDNGECFKRVFDYFRNHIEFVKVYLKEFIQRDTNIWFYAGEKQQNLEKKAYSEIHFEIFDSIYSILGGQFRLAGFVRSNQKLIRQLIGAETSYENFLVKQLINCRFVQTFQQFINKIFQETHSGMRNLPVTFLLSVVWLFIGLEKLPFPKQFKKKQFNSLFYVINEYFTSLTVTEAKNNQKQMSELLILMRTLLNRSYIEKDQFLNWIEKTRLRLWKSLIQCDVLQKKLKGINKIKEFYDVISQKFITSAENSSVFCTKEHFKQWLKNQEFLKILFETNEHSQVIKKGCQMVQYFYASKLFSMNDIVYIWDTCFNKHEAIKKIIFQLWNDLTQYVVGQQDWKLFIGVFTQNEQLINEEWQIESLFAFMHSLKSINQSQSIQNLVKMLYNKTLQRQKFISEFAHQVSYFGGDSLVLRNIIDNCLKMISEKYQPVLHLRLLAKIFSELSNYPIYIPSNIIQVLINQLKILVQRENNEKFIITIFNLFNEIISAKGTEQSGMRQSKMKFSFKNFQQLWQIFHDAHHSIKRLFYSWVVTKFYNSSLFSTNYSINHKFSHEFKLQIFANILNNQLKINHQKMDLNEFIFFRELFIYANLKAGVIEMRYYGSNPGGNRKVIKVKSKEIQGIKQLWSIFRNCQHDEVINAVCLFIKDLHLRVSGAMPPEQKSLRIRNLMETMQEYIDEKCNTLSFGLVKRSLILITRLIADIKQKIQIPKQFEKLQKTQRIHIKAFTNQSDVQDLQIFVQDSFINIKSQIAQKFQLSKDQFTLTNGRTQVPKQAYDLPYYLHHFQDNNLKITKISTENNRYIINFVNHNFYQSLIGFLNNHQVCLEAFHLLEYLDVHQPMNLFQKMQQSIEALEQIVNNKKKLYVHIYFLRVFNILVEKQVNVPLLHEIVSKLTSHLQIPIDNHLIVAYLEKLLEILNNLVRKKPYLFSLTSQLNIDSIDFRPKTYRLILNLIKYLNQNPLLRTNREGRVFIQSIYLYTNGFPNNKELFDSFVKDQNFRELMVQVFIKCDLPNIKNTMQKKISQWIKEGFSSINVERKLTQFFINQLYYQVCQDSVSRPFNPQTVSIFKLQRSILETISTSIFNQVVFQKVSQLTNEVFSENIFKAIQHQSDSPNATNYLLNGQLNLLSVIIKRNRALIKQPFVEYILFECLIYLQGKTRNIDVKCLSRQNIVLVLEILFNVIVNAQQKRNGENKPSLSLRFDKFTIKVLKSLRQFHYFQFWRGSKQWNIQPQHLSKVKAEFVGLQNPGCICYLNSLLQQLYMIEEFRYSILAIKTLQNSNNASNIQIQKSPQDSPQLLSKLKLLFMNLTYSQRSAIDPQFFTSSIKNAANRPMVKIFQQMDIDQFSMILFDKIQNKLHRMEYPNFVRNLFGGLYSNEIISQQCNHSSEREEPFLSISLEVKKHIKESFQSLVKGEILEGQNSYFCDRCDKKVKALKRLSIKRLPPHLIISLRRFEFDYEIDQKTKINKFCEFPLELNLQDYSRDKLNSMNVKNDRTSMTEEDQQKLKKQTYPSSYYLYKLKGVVVHSGSADSGHYYSFIQGKDGNWFQFNDQKVSQFDFKNLQQEAFGGKDGQYSRIKNAYLLFYERKAKDLFKNPSERSSERHQQINEQMAIEQQTSCHQRYNSGEPKRYQQKESLSLIASKQVSLGLEQNRQIIDQITKQNKKMRIFQFFFSKQYLSFNISLIKQVWLRLFNIKQDEKLKIFSQYDFMLPVDQVYSLQMQKSYINNLQDNKQLNDEFFKFFISYTFNVYLRQKHIINCIQLLNSIRDVFLKKSKNRQYFMQNFIRAITHQSFFDQFFIHCQNRERSLIVSNFISQVLEEYLVMRAEQTDLRFPDIVNKLMKLITTNLIFTKDNIIELVMILRKLLGSKIIRVKKPEYIRSVIFAIFRLDLANLLLDNVLTKPISEEEQNQKLQNLQYSESFPSDDSKTPQFVQNSCRQTTAMVKPELSIPGLDSENMQNYGQPIQIQQAPTTSQTPNYSELFGYYKSQGKCQIRSLQKQTWTLLWMIYKISKQYTRKYKESQAEQLQKQRKSRQIEYRKKQEMLKSPLNKNTVNSNISNRQSQFELKLNSESRTKNQQLLHERSSGHKSQLARSSCSQNPSSGVQSTRKKSFQRSQEQYEQSQSNRQVAQTPKMSYPSNLCENAGQSGKNQISLSYSQAQHSSQQSAHEGSTPNKNLLRKTSPGQQDSSSKVPSMDSSKKMEHQINAILNSKNNYQNDYQIHPGSSDDNKTGNNRGNHEQVIDVDADTTNSQLNRPSCSSEREHQQASNTVTNANVRTNHDQKSTNKTTHNNQPHVSPVNLPRIPPFNPVSDTKSASLQPPAIQTLNYDGLSLFHDQIQQLYKTLQNIPNDQLTKLISKQKDTKTIIAFSQLIAEAAFDNAKLSQSLLTAIQNALRQYQSIKYRPFLLLIQRLILIEDSLSAKRIQNFFRIFKQSLKCNDKYFLECDFIHQWLLRYVAKSKAFYKVLSLNPMFINDIKIWCIQKRSPGLQTIKKHRQPNCERHVFRLHGLVVSGQIKDYEMLSDYKIDSFQKIKQLKFAMNPRQHQQPKICEQIVKGSTIEYYFDHSNQWFEGTVEENYYGCVLASFSFNRKLERSFFQQDDQRLRLKVSSASSSNK